MICDFLNLSKDLLTPVQIKRLFVEVLAKIVLKKSNITVVLKFETCFYHIHIVILLLTFLNISLVSFYNVFVKRSKFEQNLIDFYFDVYIFCYVHDE